MQRKLYDIMLILSPMIIFLIFWEWFVYDVPKRKFLFAAPSLVFEKAIEEYQNIAFWNDIYITSLETVLGLYWLNSWCFYR